MLDGKHLCRPVPFICCPIVGEESVAELWAIYMYLIGIDADCRAILLMKCLYFPHILTGLHKVVIEFVRES